MGNAVGTRPGRHRCNLYRVSSGRLVTVRRLPSAQVSRSSRPGRLNTAAAAIRQHGANRYCMGVNVLTIFERLHNLRGMEEVLMDLYTNEAEIRRLLDRLTEYHVELIRYWAEIGADAMFLGDDWGSQRSMITSAAMWRRLFRPHYAKLFDETHHCGMDVIYHSCGNVLDIIPDLIDIGADVVDPIQPVAMDAGEIAGASAERSPSTAASTRRNWRVIRRSRSGTRSAG